MQFEKAREASFTPASSSARSRKAAASSSSSNVPWPHPTKARGKAKAFPAFNILARAGLYHDPTPEAPDRVRSFTCGTTIQDWKAGDEPLKRLAQANADSPLVLIQASAESGTEKGEKWVWEEAKLMPDSKAMIEARLTTFGKEWPYDGEEGWKPTSRNVSALTALLRAAEGQSTDPS